MKKYAFLITLSFFGYFLQAQEFSTDTKYSIEFSIVRYAKEIGIFEAEGYPNRLSFLNGMNLIYSPNFPIDFILGVRSLANIKSLGGFTFEEGTNNGYEFHFGIQTKGKKDKKLFLTYGAQFFSAFAIEKGTYENDTPPFVSIVGHKKRFIGGAAKIKVNYRIAKTILLYVDSRLIMGNHVAKKIDNYNILNLPRLPSTQYVHTVFEPIHSFGIRFFL